MIGHARFGVPGTWRAGSDAVRQILRQQAGSIWVIPSPSMAPDYRAII
jgi:D-alanyl-D-alanine carboxypeptidase/D-alanyl-D-alanine-endopeptidase (penicillin-binding protein 4)